MGAKTWMLLSADDLPRDVFKKLPKLQRQESIAFAQKLFSEPNFVEQEDGDLTYTNPSDDEVFVGCFPGVTVIAATEFGLDYPSKLPIKYLKNMPYSTVILHAMHSVVDWFAFAVWENGELVRSLSLSPDSGILEDIGEKLDFELPFWNGKFPVDDEDVAEKDRYPFVFHPLDLGEAALGALCGYVLEGDIDIAVFDPEEVPLIVLKR